MALQVKLRFTDNALRLIAKKAMAKNTGARGLRAILENILTDAMFEVYADRRICPSLYVVNTITCTPLYVGCLRMFAFSLGHTR